MTATIHGLRYSYSYSKRMTGIAAPWRTPSSEGRSVQLIQVPPDVLERLANGDLAGANLAASRHEPQLSLAPYLVAPECRSVWQRRHRQIAGDPYAAAWVTRLVLDAKSGDIVGRAGFHGPPDGVGMVEIGYAIDPAHRRRGYARAALEALLDAAARERSVRVVRATIQPDNTASRALVDQYGFVDVGVQWDEEDGEETIFELPLDPTGMTFRRPGLDDLKAVYRVHADPRTNIHNPSPAGPDDSDASARRLDSWLGHWQEHGFGYWVIENQEAEIIGFAGLRHAEWLGRPVLNLYYRFSPAAWGKGYAKAAARFAVAWAAESHAGLRVIARTRPENLPSQRTAAAAGLVRAPELENYDDDGPVVIYASAQMPGSSRTLD